MITRSKLIADLKAMGVLKDDIVMVHASLRSVGVILGGPDALIDALLTAVGPNGTIMAYTDWQDGVQHITRCDAADRVDTDLLDELPPFCPATSRARRAYGVFPEFLRTYRGAVRSGNPDASVCAVGARAQWLCADHPLQYGYGPGSPLAKIVEASGKVLLLGSPFDAVTLLHYSEHMARVPGKRIIRYREPVLIDGQKQWVKFEEFDTNDPVVSAAPEGYFADVVRSFLSSGYGSDGMVGNAKSYLLDAPRLHAFAVEWIEDKYGTQPGN
jgi:aminoglycoside 3-N-acetyltransferase